MDDHTRRAFERLSDRLGETESRLNTLWNTYHAEQRTADRARQRAYAELDAWIVEVQLLQGGQRNHEHRLKQLESEQHVQSQSERIMAAVQAATDVFTDVLFALLPDDRAPMKARFAKALGDLFTEVISGSTVMASGVVVALDKDIKGVAKRVTELEERQVGGGDGNA